MFNQNRINKAVFFVYLLISFSHLSAQDTVKFETIHSIKDIPHKTAMQKWMWIHRSVAFFMLQDKKIFYDTSYIQSYKKNLVLTIPLSSRFMNFKMIDRASGNSLQFTPNMQYDLGLSINSKFASFLINTGASFFEKDNGERGKTNYTDYQFNLYGKARTTDINFQIYEGFYIKNSPNYAVWDTANSAKFSVRSDIRAISFGYNTYYIFNYKKFSYRNSFAFTEKQIKSAGSPLIGGYWSAFSVESDSSLSGFYFNKVLSPHSNIQNALITNVGVNLGYIYTFVFNKNFYVTLSMVQGLGVDRSRFEYGDQTIEDRDFHFASKQNLRLATGFDNGLFFAGAMGMFDFYYFNDEVKTTIDYSMGKGRFFIGYRFPFEKIERKVLRKLNLIDYRL